MYVQVHGHKRKGLCQVWNIFLILGLLKSSNSEGNQLGVIRPAYMSLPSPNIPCTEDEKKKELEEQSWQNWHTSCETEGEDQESSINLLERRGALVPPKMLLGNGDRSGRESSCSRYKLPFSLGWSSFISLNRSLITQANIS